MARSGSRIGSSTRARPFTPAVSPQARPMGDMSWWWRQVAIAGLAAQDDCSRGLEDWLLRTYRWVEQLEASGGVVETGTVGSTAVSGHSPVTLDTSGLIVPASNATAVHALRPLWLTGAAAASGSQATLQSSGTVIEPSWSWTPGSVYLGATGVLTQTAPTAATGAVFIARLGVATSSTTIHLDRQPSVVLAA